MENNLKKAVAVLILLEVIAPGCIGLGGNPAIEVSYPKAVVSPMGKDAISAFMFISNKGDADDYLISAKIEEYPGARVELHDVVKGKMVKVEKIKIPAGEVVELRAGSYHIMGFGVANPGDEITLVLKFEKSGEIEVKAVLSETGMEMEGMMH